MSEYQYLSSIEKDLTKEEDAVIRQKLIQLLSRRTRLFTLDDSSSIRVETAEGLFSSICFTIHLFLTENQLPYKYLLSADMDAVFTQATEMLQQKIALGKARYQAACISLPDIHNLSLFDTVRSIGGFFQTYDYLFFADQITCDIDYQLCRPVSESFRGIEYINEYLLHLLIENDFLRHFSKETMICLLNAYCADYKGLLINLYEPVLTNAVGLSLIGEDVSSLDINEAALAKLSRMFERLPPKDAQAKLKEAAVSASRFLGIYDAAAKNYMAKAAAGLYPRIKAALPKGNLNGVFLALISHRS